MLDAPRRFAVPLLLHGRCSVVHGTLDGSAPGNKWTVYTPFQPTVGAAGRVDHTVPRLPPAASAMAPFALLSAPHHATTF